MKKLAKEIGVWYTEYIMNLKKYSGKLICVAISGGVDSVVLLHYLKNCERECGYFLSAVHCEHGIRGEESLADARFVEEYCKELGVELTVFSRDCLSRAAQEKKSLETAAREFRMEVFDRLIADGKADYIATAHHANDEAETVLFRLARGTLSGVKGMTEEENGRIRPILGWTRAEIEGYAQEKRLVFCVDKTNADTTFTRNKIRWEVLPKIEEAVPGATGNILRFAALHAEDDGLLYRYAEKLLTKTQTGFCVAFSEEKPLFCRACLLALKGLGVEKDYQSVHLADAFALQKSERGSMLDFPKGVVAEKGLEGVVFFLKKQETPCEKPISIPYCEEGFDGGRYEVKISKTPILPKNEWKVLRFDGGKIPDGAVFRFRQEGDEITRFGGGTKSLKKFFNEEKVPVFEREYLPLIADGAGKEVYAVCGVEISEKVKVDLDTEKVFYIAIQRKE